MARSAACVGLLAMLLERQDGIQQALELASAGWSGSPERGGARGMAPQHVVQVVQREPARPARAAGRLADDCDVGIPSPTSSACGPGDLAAAVMNLGKPPDRARFSGPPADASSSFLRLLELPHLDEWCPERHARRQVDGDATGRPGRPLWLWCRPARYSSASAASNRGRIGLTRRRAVRGGCLRLPSP
jgi:hypothetical protein